MRYKVFSILIFIAVIVHSQQVPLNKQYLINRYALSPAFSGFNQNYEAFASYRNDLAGINGSPQTSMLTINGPITGNACFGVLLMNDKAGIFRNTSAAVNYTYHVKLHEKQYVSLALLTEIIGNYTELSNSYGEGAVDPLITQYQLVSGSAFNVGFSANYSNNRFNGGLHIPRLLKSECKNQLVNDNCIYTMMPYFRLYGMYQYTINYAFDVLSALVIQKVAGGPVFAELATLIVYQNMVWAGINLNNSNIGISVGASPYEKIAIHYSYELPARELSGSSNGSHEITVGYLIGKNKADKYHFSIFKPKSLSPYHNWSNE